MFDDPVAIGMLAHEWGMELLCRLATKCASVSFDAAVSAARDEQTDTADSAQMPEQCAYRLVNICRLAYKTADDGLWAFIVARVHSTRASFNASAAAKELSALTQKHPRIADIKMWTELGRRLHAYSSLMSHECRPPERASMTNASH